MRRITVDDMRRDPEGSARILRGRAVVSLMRAGWRPPPLTDDQAARLIDDMARIGNVRRRSNVLSATERYTLALIARGETVEGVAEREGKSRETVKTQQKNIRRKLGARNSAHAVALALRAGELELEELAS